MSASLYASWVKKAACARFGVTLAEIDSPARTATIARARQIAMAVVRDLFPLVSYPELGTAFGGRDHTTAIGAVQKVKKMRADGGVWSSDYDAVRKLAIEMMPEDRRPT